VSINIAGRWQGSGLALIRSGAVWLLLLLLLLKDIVLCKDPLDSQAVLLMFFDASIHAQFLLVGQFGRSEIEYARVEAFLCDSIVDCCETVHVEIGHKLL